MVVEKNTLSKDILFFIKEDLEQNIQDPIATNRPEKSKFVMTSYPSRPVNYPIITIKTLNVKAVRAGMQTTAQDITINLEIRIWARNTKERDEIFDSVFSRLGDIQFTSVTGSVANNLHDLTIGSAVEVTEEGDKGIKSKVISIEYKFYNI